MHPNHKESQKVFLGSILPEKNKSMHEHNLQVETQKWIYEDEERGEGKIGIPDLFISNNKISIVVENKFFAPFSKKDQMVRYSDWLHDNPKESQYLILLTIQSERRTKERAMIGQFSVVDETIKTFEDVTAHLHYRGITLKVVLWDELIEQLPPGNEIIDSLIQYVKNTFLNEVIFDKEMHDMIESSKVPEALEMVWNAVKTVKDRLGPRGHEVGNIGQSRLQYGFSFVTNKYSFWFGCYLPVWKSHGAPWILQMLEEDNERYANKLSALFSVAGSGMAVVKSL